jgi:hypothetical protein
MEMEGGGEADVTYFKANDNIFHRMRTVTSAIEAKSVASSAVSKEIPREFKTLVQPQRIPTCDDTMIMMITCT